MAAVAACALAEAANVDRVARTGEPGRKFLEMFKVFLKKSPTRINRREPPIFPCGSECVPTRAVELAAIAV